jgi:Rrf2 family protein
MSYKESIKLFSNTSKYAIKAVLYLAIHSNTEKRVVISDIANSINVPQAYIAKLLQELSRKNIISSLRGPNGGFFLTEEDKKKSCIDILVALNGVNTMTSCLLSIEQCDENKPCPLHALANPLRNELFENMSNISVSELAKSIEAGETQLPL